MTLTEILYEFQNDERYICRNGVWYYDGPRGFGYMPHIAQLAYRCWTGQGYRCNNKKSKEYQWYGAIGVKRLWAPDECINFYINSLLTRNKWNRPVVSRKKDQGDYCSSNCELKENEENSSEINISNLRRMVSTTNVKSMHKANCHKITLKNVKTGEVKEYNSNVQACEELGREKTYIKSALKFDFKIMSSTGDQYEIVEANDG